MGSLAISRRIPRPFGRHGTGPRFSLAPMRCLIVAASLGAAVALAGCGGAPADGGYNQDRIAYTQGFCGSIAGAESRDSNQFYDSFVSCVKHRLPRVSHELALRWAHEANG